MKQKIAVIGAGWYGCHIATTLLSLGFKVTVYEAETYPLSQASGNNQFRLHLGFHYPRHFRTRVQSRDGFQRFVERYPTLSTPCENIYGVPEKDSLLDFYTYRLIMMSTGVEFEEVPTPSWTVGIEGCIKTEERVLETRAARRYFMGKLKDNILLHCRAESIVDRGKYVVINNNNTYDYVIDCTWGHYDNAIIGAFYEPTLLLYYSLKLTAVPVPAFTLVDGPLCSLYKTEDLGIYTLSSVPHTALGRYNTAAEARKAMLAHSVDKVWLSSKIAQFEEQITRYIPAFKSSFEYHSPQFSVKTKMIGAHDDRSCYVDNSGRYIRVLSGKIDTIFTAMERVLYYLEAGSE